MIKKNGVSILKSTNKNLHSCIIPIDSQDSILRKIESIVIEEKLYLNQKCSLSFISSQISVNNRYLSWVINNRLNKKFPDFINDLRISYFLEHLCEGHQFNKFTTDVIASELGYKWKRPFEIAFKKKMGVGVYKYIRTINNPSNINQH